MGMYTELRLQLPVNRSKPGFDNLRAIVAGNGDRDLSYVLRGNYYRREGNHPPTLTSRYDHPEVAPDELNLSIASSIKNYDREYERLLVWLERFVSHDMLDPGQQVGTYRYEEDLLCSPIIWTGKELVIVSPAEAVSFSEKCQEKDP